MLKWDTIRKKKKEKEEEEEEEEEEETETLLQTVRSSPGQALLVRCLCLSVNHHCCFSKGLGLLCPG